MTLLERNLLTKLVQDAYEEGVEDGLERGFDPTDGAPLWIDSVARVNVLHALRARSTQEGDKG